MSARHSLLVNVVDEATPLIQSIKTLIDKGIAQVGELPANPVESFVRKGSATVILLPSDNLMAWVFGAILSAKRNLTAAPIAEKDLHEET